MNTTLSVGDVLSRTRTLVSENIGQTATAVAVLAGIAVITDKTLASGGPPLFFISALATIYFQTSITQSIMSRHDLIKDGEYGGNMFGSVFGINFLSNIAILLGLVVFIIPGIFLMLRWSIAVPAVVANADGSTNAMRESWKTTKPHMWAIFAIFSIILAPLFATICFQFASAFLQLGIEETLAVNIPLQIIGSLSSVLGWYAAVAVYERIADASSSLSDIFA